MIKTPVVTALNTGTYAPITLNDQAAEGFSIHTSDGSAFYYAVDASGTGEALVPDNASLSWGHYESAHATIMYAKSVTGTPDIIVNLGNTKYEVV